MAWNFYAYKLTPEEMPVDILRMMYNKSLDLPIVNLWVGHGCNGKSTDLFHAANMWYHIKRYGPAWKYYPVNWKRWDWKRNVCRSPKQFVWTHNHSRGEFLALEEAADRKLLNYMTWFSDMADVFSSTRDTQGYLGNANNLITPHANELLKKAKEKIDFKLWAYRKIKPLMRNIIRPRWVDINYIKDKVIFRYVNDWRIDFSLAELREAQRYTAWLEEFKKEIAKRNEETVGLRKKIFWCYNCGSKHDYGKCPLEAKGEFVDVEDDKQRW